MEWLQRKDQLSCCFENTTDALERGDEGASEAIFSFKDHGKLSLL